MWRIRHGFLQHAFHFFDFFHQMKLRRQTAGSISQHDVDPARFRGLDGIEANGCGIACGLRNHGYIVALAPSLKLLTRSGTESIACRQQHRFTLRLEVFGEFADRRGFTRAVDTGKHNHERLPGFRQDQRFLQRLNQVVQRIFQRTAQFVAVFEAFEADTVAHVFHQVFGGFHAHIAGNQHGFQLFVQVLVDLSAAEHAGQRFCHFVA